MINPLDNHLTFQDVFTEKHHNTEDPKVLNSLWAFLIMYFLSSSFLSNYLFGGCGSYLQHRSYLPHSIQDRPLPGMEPTSHALEDRFLTPKHWITREVTS